MLQVCSVPDGVGVSRALTLGLGNQVHCIPGHDPVASRVTHADNYAVTCLLGLKAELLGLLMSCLS